MGLTGKNISSNPNKIGTMIYRKAFCVAVYQKKYKEFKYGKKIVQANNGRNHKFR